MVGVKSSSDPGRGMAMAEEAVEVIKGAAMEVEELLRTPLTQLEEGATATLCCSLTLPILEPGVRVRVSDIMVRTEPFSRVSMKLGEGIRIFFEGVSTASVALGLNT